jgi:hypothetical protein
MNEKKASRGSMSIQDLEKIIPSDMSGMLTSVVQLFDDEYFHMQGFELIFQYDDRFDFVVTLNHNEYGDSGEEEKVLETASYTLHLIRQIPVMFPIVSNDFQDFGCSIEQSEFISDSTITKLEREKMVWELRKALSVETREWFLKETERCVQLYLTGTPGYERVFYISIPHSCPKRHYLSIIHNLKLWEQLVLTWAWPADGAFGLVERNPEETEKRILKYNGCKF